MTDYAQHIRRLVDSAPPLNDEQRAKLARLLPPVENPKVAELRALHEVEEEQRVASVRRSLAKRRRPEELAVEVIAKRIEALRAATRPDHGEA
jgi:hypothetical protein